MDNLSDEAKEVLEEARQLIAISEGSTQIGFHVIWTCPCGAENEDWFEMTALPMCESCQADRDWDLILSEGRLAMMNNLLRSEGK